MSREAFRTFNFKKDSVEMIREVNSVIQRYQAQGYTLTLRQIYYQMVSRNLILNNERSYKNLGNLINNGRLAGMIDWSAVEDRTRETHTPSHWRTPAGIIEACVNQYRIDKWDNQPRHVRVMVEKQALEGILIPLCEKLDIQFSANRGYSSSSAMYETGQELRGHIQRRKAVHVLYLGDHDPSGMDMSRDVADRLSEFSLGTVTVHRLALNINQVEEFGLPPNFAKTTDARSKAYIKEFGEESWELDAIDPETLVRLVTDAVIKLRDDDLYRERQRRECRMRIEMKGFLDGASKKRPDDYDDPAGFEPMTNEGIYKEDTDCERDCGTDEDTDSESASE